MKYDKTIATIRSFRIFLLVECNMKDYDIVNDKNGSKWGENQRKTKIDDTGI